MTRADAASTPGDLRVLHVIGSVDPTHGGPTTAIWNMMDALRLTGVVSELVTTTRETAAGDSMPTRQNDSGITHRVISFPQQTRFYALSVPLLAWLARNVHRYDLVVAHGLFNFPPLAAAWWARARHVPYVVRPCGVLNRWGRLHRRPMLKRASLGLLEGGLLRDAALVHFTSGAELEQAAELGIRMRPLVLPLGLAAPGAWTDDRPDAHDPRRVLFLGRITPIKNLDVLMRAFSQIASSFPGARLSIAGEGPPHVVVPLRSLAAELGIADRVDWLGFVQGAEKEAVLRQATVFAMPSASENFGMAAVEALARGVAVVVSRGVGIADQVAASGAGLVCDAAVDDLARCLAILLGEPDLRSQCGTRARQLFDEEFSLPALGRGLRTAYEATIGRQRSLGPMMGPG